MPLWKLRGFGSPKLFPRDKDCGGWRLTPSAVAWAPFSLHCRAHGESRNELAYYSRALSWPHREVSDLLTETSLLKPNPRAGISALLCTLLPFLVFHAALPSGLDPGLASRRHLGPLHLISCIVSLNYAQLYLLFLI